VSLQIRATEFTNPTRGPLAGWGNNAAVFRDASLHDVPATELLELITLNLSLAVTGCASAARRFLASGRPGAIVNVSSHQAQRRVPGALPYATAKAAIEGLTPALAVDYGPPGSAQTPSLLDRPPPSATRRCSQKERRSTSRCPACIHLAASADPEEVTAVVAHLPLTRGELRQRRDRTGGRRTLRARPRPRGTQLLDDATRGHPYRSPGTPHPRTGERTTANPNERRVQPLQPLIIGTFNLHGPLARPRTGDPR
jgi:NAD(P)-dependent dehydrogenase (short-subunit alcohol dehydrogenase family)